MLLKVQIEELIDRDCLSKYCEHYGGDPKKLAKDKETEVYINEKEAEDWGFIGKTRDLFGGEK